MGAEGHHEPIHLRDLRLEDRAIVEKIDRLGGKITRADEEIALRRGQIREVRVKRVEIELFNAL